MVCFRDGVISGEEVISSVKKEDPAAGRPRVFLCGNCKARKPSNVGKDS
jgi:hypothetical protein